MAEERAGSRAVAGALDEVTSTFEGISLGTRRQQVRAISDPSPQGWHTATDQPRGFDGMRDEHPTVALPVQQSTSAVYPHVFDAAVTPSPTPGPAAERIPYRRRGFGVFAAIAATLAAIIAVAALIFALATRSGSAGKEPDKPTLSGSPPGDVQLRDEGSRIEVSWTDPTHGTVSFLVAMGHPGEQLKPVGTLGPGQTSYQMSALNPALDYCFAVIAVYRKDRFATSRPACTERPTGGATPK